MSSNRVIRRANPNSIQNKVLVGYQGWFTCAGDGPPVHQGHHGWLHWFDKPLPDGGRPNFDLFPDVSEYTPEELYPAPGLSFTDANGQSRPAMLFSSTHPVTVQRHFHWMAKHGIDGAFLQRFGTQCEVDGNYSGPAADLMRLRDEVLDRVREAAEKENRVWAIMYDVTGVPADRVEHVLRTDWDHLLKDKEILNSPYYLRERGQPVIAIWGFGFQEAHHDPNMVASIVRHLKSVTPGGAYVWGGVPSQWRTHSGDMDPNPAFLDVFKNEFDALSPWTVGRFHNRESLDQFVEERMRGDLKELKDLPKKVDYFPTIWPGGSSHNLSEGKIGLNFAPREGGKFFWRQIWSVKHLGVRTIYIAMFDEYDEGTAILPAVPLKRSLPKVDDPNRQFPFIALDADGIDNLSPDWYLRIAGFASEAMKDEKRVYEDIPKKELDDYWANRPRYETDSHSSAGGSGASGSSSSYSGGAGNTTTSATSNAPATPAATAPDQSSDFVRAPVRKNTGAWGAFGDDEDGPAPPPYTLEAIEETPAAATPSASNTTTSPVTSSASPVVTQQQQPSPASASTQQSYASSSSSSPSVPHVGVQRHSSYSVSAGTPQSQGATGLGRATTYSAPSPQPGTFVVQSFNQPTGGQPGNPSLYRPPVHPSSPLANPNLNNRPTGTSTPPLSYAPYQRKDSAPYNIPVGHSPNGSVSNLSQNFSNNMNLGPSGGSPSTPSAHLPQHTAHYGSASGGPSPQPMNAALPSPGSTHSSAPYNNPNVPPQNPTPNTSGGYFGTTTSYGAGAPTGAYSSGVISNPGWTPASSQPPTTSNNSPMGAAVNNSNNNSVNPSANLYPATTSTTSPNASPSGFAPPTGPPPSSGYTNPASTINTSNLYSAPTTGPPPQQSGSSNPSFPPPNWVVPNANANQPAGYGAPALPPRPNAYPGTPGGSNTGPQNNTLLGGIYKSATGVVDRVAGENTRMQIESGVLRAAQTGTKLLGKFTK